MYIWCVNNFLKWVINLMQLRRNVSYFRFCSDLKKNLFDFFKVELRFWRVDQRRETSDIRKGLQIDWNLIQLYLHWLCENFLPTFYHTVSNFELFRLFYHQFAWRCIQIAVCHVVNAKFWTFSREYEIILIFFRLRTIFDWRTSTTYIIAFTLQFLFTAYLSVNDTVLMAHSFGSVWMFMAFVDDITIDLANLDTYNRSKTSAARLYEHLCEFIRFHTEIKQ